MPKDDSLHVRKAERNGEIDEEARSLLSGSSNDDSPDDDHPVVDHGPPSRAPPRQPLRQSSISYPASNGSPRTPRTPNRVRFELDDRLDSDAQADGHVQATSHRDPSDWVEEEDYLASNNSASASRGGSRISIGQRAPLLTDIEAPSVTLASEDFNAEDLLESARPKSGMRSAFMNMANSIM